MDILQMIMNAQNGAAVDGLSQRFGLEQRQTASALEQLVPALVNGMKQNGQPAGLEALIGLLGSTRPNAPEATETGNNILAQILGSKDVSRSVAAQASANTGISTDVLKQMLPMVAVMVMTSLSQQPGAKKTGGLLGLLDANNDGSVVDDVLGMAAKFLRK